MTIKEGDRFKATDRLGRESTWQLIEIKKEIHYVLEAIGDTYKKFENKYIASMKNKGKFNDKAIEKGRKKKDFCTIEVGPAWFCYRKIEVFEEE